MEDIEKTLENQIPEYQEPVEQVEPIIEESQAPVQKEEKKHGSLGKINVNRNLSAFDNDEDSKWAGENHITRIGESIFENQEIREGWMNFDKELLGDRAIFYPENWEFKIRPATVEAIRNWSTIDDENINSVDKVFNEILKSCLKIVTPTGPLPWYNINAWDRFFFILIIREYTFINGESKIEYMEDCPNCDNPVTFTLTSGSLLYELPDPEVMPMFDQNQRMWIIDPAEYGLPMEEPIRLWLPTLEKDMNIKQWVINRYQENPNKELDNVMIKFLPWFVPKISKDDTIAQRQIKEFKHKFSMWDIDTFQFMDSVITNIMVTPDTKLIMKCPTCGEEVTSPIRFQNGASSLFAMESKFKKFGKK